MKRPWMLLAPIALLGLTGCNPQSFGQAYEDPCPPCPPRYQHRQVRHGDDEEQWGQSRQRNVSRIEGDITGETLYEFRPAPIIILDSPGGEIGPALRIAEIIRREGSTVVIPRGADCLSACAIIWVAAEHRKIEGRVGFHAPHRGRMQPAPEAEQAIARAYQRWGYSEEFIRWSMSADPDDMAYLTPKLAQRFNISVEGYEQTEKQPVKTASVSLDDIVARIERLEKLITERPAPEAPVSRWYRGR